ncbi:MAG: tape measure protein [Betaproteobacteria bacterium]
MANDFEIRIRALVEGIANVHSLAQELSGVQDEAAKPVGNEIDKLGEQAEKSDSAIAQLTRRVAGLVTAAALIKFGVDSVDAAIQFEKINNALAAATGSSESAAAEYEFVRETADRLGLSLAGAAEQYAKLAAAAKGTTLAGGDTRNVFEAVSTASRVLGLSADETGGALTAIQQIISKGTVSAEELRGQLGERLPGAFQIAARAMGVTTQKLGELLEGGLIPATEFVPKFAAELKKSFDGGVEAAANSTQASIERLKNTIFETQVSLSQGGFLDGLAQSINLVTNALQSDDAAISVGVLSDTVKQLFESVNSLFGVFQSSEDSVGGFVRVIEGAALGVAAVRDGVSATSALFSGFGGIVLSTLGATISAIGTVASAFDESVGASLKETGKALSEQGQEARDAFKQTFDEFGIGNSALAQTLDRITAIEEKAKSTAKEAKGIAPGFDEATIAAQQLQKSEEEVSATLKGLKIDAAQFGSAYSDSAKQAIDGLNKLVANATSTGQQIRAAIENALKDAKTVGDIDKIQQALIRAAGQGKISADEIQRALDGVADASRRVAGQVEGPLGESFKRMGLTSKEALGAAANQAEVDFRRIAESGQTSIDQQIIALNKYADAYKAANNGILSDEIATQQAILAARQSAQNSFSAAGLDSRIRQREQEIDADLKTRQAAASRDLAESEKREADASKAAADAAKEREAGLAGIGGVIERIINSTTSLSGAVSARFSEAFGLPVQAAVGSIDELRASLAAVQNEIAFNRSGADAFGESSLGGLVKLNNAANVLKESFFQQSIAVKTLEENLLALGSVNESNVGSFERLAQGAQVTSQSFLLLDENQLSGLQAAIDGARNKVAAFNAEINKAISQITGIGDSLQDELDRASGNLAAIQQRDFERRRQELLNLAAQAGSAGADETRRALSLLDEVNRKRLAQIEEEKAARLAAQEKTHADALAKVAAKKAIEDAQASAVVAVRASAAPTVSPTTASAPQASSGVSNTQIFNLGLGGSTLDDFVRREIAPRLDRIIQKSQ